MIKCTLNYFIVRIDIIELYRQFNQFSATEIIGRLWKQL